MGIAIIKKTPSKCPIRERSCCCLAGFTVSIERTLIIEPSGALDTVCETILSWRGLYRKNVFLWVPAAAEYVSKLKKHSAKIIRARQE